MNRYFPVITLSAGCLLGMAFLGLQPGIAQEIRVTGMVKEYKKTNALSASVIFEKQPDAAITIISASGNEGYKARIYRRAAYQAKVSSPGYISSYRVIDFLADSVLERTEFRFDFELVPIAVQALLPFSDMVFDPSSAKITPQAVPELTHLAEILEENPGIVIQLEGYTDSQSQSAKSRTLARDRIKAIRKWLVDKGINGKRIKLKAVGGGYQREKIDTPDAHRANRRVEIRILAM
jgi:OmpA-OmpF porin, OOP family